jgi:hypothetical protein
MRRLPKGRGLPARRWPAGQTRGGHCPGSAWRMREAASSSSASTRCNGSRENRGQSGGVRVAAREQAFRPGREVLLVDQPDQECGAKKHNLGSGRRRATGASSESGPAGRYDWAGPPRIRGLAPWCSRGRQSHMRRTSCRTKMEAPAHVQHPCRDGCAQGVDHRRRAARHRARRAARSPGISGSRHARRRPVAPAASGGHEAGQSVPPHAADPWGALGPPGRPGRGRARRPASVTPRTSARRYAQNASHRCS